MGMTGDLEAAIAAGSTMVRVGTAIFGARAAKAKGVDPGSGPTAVRNKSRRTGRRGC
jgi:hypothetical protein